MPTNKFKVIRFSILVFILFLGSNHTKAEEHKDCRPSIGLVLSGGGAKGLVYIPLLKVIDSLNLKIDYITGTSMGALVGGLYSIGYSGKELDSIAHSLDWTGYLSDALPMSKINMEEKDEYGRYQLELKSNSIVPSLPMGFIEGQNIMRLLNDLTFDVQHINDFSKFKIPFKCFAADIVNGESVEFNKGNLALALRASMSIPTIFSPIDTAGKILVDGGIVNNFPVEELKNMGADFIIGANSSGYTFKKRELTTLVKVFEQMLNISTKEAYQDKKDMCDLLIDYSEALNSEGFGSSDFNNINELIQLGERVVKNFIPFLSQIAEEQKKYDCPDSSLQGQQWKNKNNIHLEKFDINIENNKYQSIIKNKIEFKDPKNATNYEINRAVDRIYGTRFFDRVYYYLDYPKDNLAPKLVFKTEGVKKFAYKIGLHYDPELSAGITLNLTHRSLGKFTSRSLVSIDVSNNPKIRAGYQVYFGDSGWWLSLNEFFSFISQTNYVQSKSLGLYDHLYSNSLLAFNWTIGQNNLVSIQTGIEYLNKKLAIGLKNKATFNNESILSKTPYHNIHFQLKMERNTLDKPFFPSKGIHTGASLKFIPYGNGKIERYINTKDSINDKIKSELQVFRPEFSAYSKLHLFFEQYIPLHKMFNLHYRWDGGWMFISHGLKGRSFDFPSQDAFFMGGMDERERERLDAFIPFMGNKEGYTQAFNFTSLWLEGQIIPVKNIYILPRFSFMMYDNAEKENYREDKIYFNHFKNIKYAYSGGLALAYNSLIGPIKISIAKSSNFERWIFYTSLGYRF
ncbi:MAG: patatin-like phospholipase family protein [Chitinophagales bacterium]|nr:patatin-like phospholipase family protein [Chitinophagales bacterium]MCZ2393825.1 patatin-like phospholipase family protein [Chitinophagales bacterium]